MKNLYLTTENKFIFAHFLDYEALSSLKDPPALKIRDVMEEERVKIFENDSTRDTALLMRWEGILHACVFSEDNKLVGVVNYKSLRRISNVNMQIKDVMHKEFHKIFGHVDAQVGIDLVTLEPDHCVPVVENGSIVGILSVDNFESIREIHQ